MVTAVREISGFAFDETAKPSAYVQWKGTDVCMDFHCECGAHCHLDGYFAYAVKCPHCGAEWEMPWHIYPRKLDRESESGKWQEPLLLEPDETMEVHFDNGDDGCPNDAP